LLLGGLIVLGRRLLLLRRRVLWEDALKQIYAAKNEARPTTPSEIAGRLRLSLSAMLRLAQALEAAGLVHSRSGSLQLTSSGEQLGPERAEHRLSPDEISALADHLSHPRTDPHGDTIPSPTGEFRARERTPLTDWPRDRFAVVVHVEDEPPQALRKALEAGLAPGTILRVIDRDTGAITYETSAGRCTVSPAIAANIDVRAAAESEQFQKPLATLAELPLGNKAEIVALSERCTGLSRRRLLDLGFTAGTTVKAVLANLEDAAHAYEIRGSVIALRKEQADQVLVRSVATPGATPAADGRG
jgi:DtxR family Mn-dependent transcriptional regulator